MHIFVDPHYEIFPLYLQRLNSRNWKEELYIFSYKVFNICFFHNLNLFFPSFHNRIFYNLYFQNPNMLVFEIIKFQTIFHKIWVNKYLIQLQNFLY